MAVFSWPSAAVNGTSQVIPKVCPNCLKPATVEYRYGYKGPIPILNNTTYFQSFYYCADCEKVMDRWFSYCKAKNWLLILSIVVVIGSLVGGAILSDSKALPNTPAGRLMVFAFPLGGIVLMALLYRAVRKAKVDKHPLDPSQALRQPAAYYVGQSFGGLGNAYIYRAYRIEWLKALVQANPDNVDEKTWQKFVGTPKPAKDAGGKPFAG